MTTLRSGGTIQPLSLNTLVMQTRKPALTPGRAKINQPTITARIPEEQGRKFRSLLSLHDIKIQDWLFYHIIRLLDGKEDIERTKAAIKRSERLQNSARLGLGW